MNTLTNVDGLSAPGPIVQSNFEQLDFLVTMISTGTGVPASTLPAAKVLYIRQDAGSGIPRLYARENGAWVAK